jgi:hypothetical protein
VSYLDNFVNRHVLLVGKVTQLRGEQATLDSEGTVTVILNRVRVYLASICLLQTSSSYFRTQPAALRVCARKNIHPPYRHGTPLQTIYRTKPLTSSFIKESHLANGNAAQVIGKVNPDLSIKVLSAKDLGPGVGRFCPPLV